jgi:hypothetical protein
MKRFLRNAINDRIAYIPIFHGFVLSFSSLDISSRAEVRLGKIALFSDLDDFPEISICHTLQLLIGLPLLSETWIEVLVAEEVLP